MTSIILMGYEDFWEDSKGEIWTLRSMNFKQKVAFILWYVPNFPLGLIIPRGIFNIISVCLVTPSIAGWIILKLANSEKEKTQNYGIVINSILTALIVMIVIWIFS